MKELKFTIAKNGKVNVEASGFTGGECTEKSKPFLDKISGGGDNVVLKNEFYEQQEEQLEEQSY